MFRINIENLVKNKLYICKDYHIQPSEIDRMMFFDYETILEEINIIQKEQEKQNEEQEKQYSSMNKSYNPSSFMSKAQNSFKMPTVQMPKI